MTSFLKFRLLLWKNFLIQKRKPVATAFEIGLPTMFALILMVLRLRVSSTRYDDPTIWNSCPLNDLNPTLMVKTLAYSPMNDATNRVMASAAEILNMTTKGFPSEDDMVDFITSILPVNGTVPARNNSALYLGGIAFQNPFHRINGSLKFDQKVSFKVRFSYAPRITWGIPKRDTSWSTTFKFPSYQTIGPRIPYDSCNGDPGYKREGFLATQNAVNIGLMKELLDESQFEEYKLMNLLLTRHPYPPYTEDSYVLVLQQQFPLILLLSLVVIVLGIVRDIVLEKERKLKESMKMMGIGNWLHWLAWFTKHILFLLISVGIMTLFYCVTLDSKKGAVIAKTNPFIVFIYFMCYALATITYCFAASVFFKKANTGAAIGGIVFFCLYIPQFFLQNQYETMTFTSKVIACIDFQVAMAFGGTILGKFEGVGTGIQLDTFSKGVSVDDDFSMLIVIMMMLADSVVHFLFAWYVEAVFPGEFGVPQPWYFPLKASYWGLCKKDTPRNMRENNIESSYKDQEMFEKEPNERAGIKIQNLRKVFGKGSSKKVAVVGTSLNMYEGQITALLGHNGAGKTTTMSMLTGFYPATSGTAIINGFDICTEIDQVRESLGLCPQHDILFDNLTVKEHLIFFGLLKGVKNDDIMPQCREMLTDMELLPKLNAKSKTLSGGMKRKLSVCIALIGNSKVVFLDEPSSGLDPNARRNIWTVLQKNRAGRTMVLSTHFMDEADLLGDRIAIMAEGEIKCCGSSLFLKKKYGAGYHMVVVKQSSCDPAKVINIVKSHIPQAEVESNVGAELSFILPQQCVGSFEALFTAMEVKREELGISSFGASVTTMEEVFIKVGEDKDAEIGQRLKQQVQKAIPEKPIPVGDQPRKSVVSIEGAHNGIAVTKPINGNHSPSKGITASTSTLIGPHAVEEEFNHEAYDFNFKFTKNSGFSLYMQQFYGMFIKRVLHTYRNKLVTVTQLVVPLFFTIMGIATTKVLPSFVNMPSLSLTAEEYGSNSIPYASNSPLSSAMADSFAHQFMKDSSIRTINVNEQKGFKDDPNMMNFLIQQGKRSIGDYNLKYMLAGSYNYSHETNETTITAFFNNQAYHSIAVSLGSAFNGILQYLTNSTENSIETFNHPLPRLAVNKINDDVGFKNPEGFIIGFDLAFGMAFLASSFLLFLVKERATKAKHIQFVSGVHPFNFWLSTFCWDLINFMIPCVLMIFVFVAFTVSTYIDNFHWLQLLVFFFLYGWAMLPNMYLFSFAFQVPATAYVWVTMFNVLTGVATMLVVIIFSIPQLNLVSVSETLEWIFMVLFPNFSLSQGLYKFYQNSQSIETCSIFLQQNIKDSGKCCLGDICLYYNYNYLGWEKDGIGRMLVFLTAQGVVFWAIIFCHEFGWIRKIIQSVRNLVSGVKSRSEQRLSGDHQNLRDSVQEDDDVAMERSRIDNTESTELLREDKVILDNLTKYYGNFKAVDRISVGIPAGECFGLLGINGAGKTSTFKMLTGDMPISSGTAFLDGFNLNTQKEKARNHLGYCPQFDALIEQLTGRETLTLFSRLRGVTEKDIRGIVIRLINALTLGPYADKQCQTYSGGTKRKLSTAIALIGDPEVVFLDEPTTGMDPVARRMLWEVLSRVRDSGKTLVLTSHSMEECEALCTRLAVMVNGQFKCLGSIQHLKNKFGEGYTFNAKVSYSDDGTAPDLQPLKTFMDSTFPASKLTDVHENMVNYHITNTSLSWAQVFGEIERARASLKIEDYLVSQTSLEQVFIYFARTQDNPDNLRN